MLRFQTERGAMAVYAAALSGDRAIEEVPGIELDAGLRGADVERTAAARVDDAHCMRQTLPRVAAAIEHPVVIVASTVAEAWLRSDYYGEAPGGLPPLPLQGGKVEGQGMRIFVGRVSRK